MRRKKLLLAALFAALTATGSFVRIPVGFTSFTLQTFFACMAGLLLGASYGALSQGIYLLLGLLGLPVFAEGGGPMYFAVPSAGFLLGLVPMAFTVGLLRKGDSFFRLFLAELGGLVVLYAVGLPYLSLLLGTLSPGEVVLYGCLIYLPFDLVKLALGASLSKRLLPVISKSFY